MTLEEYLSKDLFLQSIVVQRFGVYDWSGAPTVPIDVLVIDERVCQHEGFPKDVATPRILVIEAMAHDPLMRYPSLADAAGYRMHRCKLFEDPDLGEVALIEFHRKETINAESP